MKKVLKIWVVIAMLFTVCFQNIYPLYAIQGDIIKSLKVNGDSIELIFNDITSQTSDFSYAIIENGHENPNDSDYKGFSEIKVDSDKGYILFIKENNGTKKQEIVFDTVKPGFNYTKKYIVENDKYTKASINITLNNVGEKVAFTTMVDDVEKETFTTTSFDITEGTVNKIKAIDEFGNEDNIIINVSAIGTSVIEPNVVISPTELTQSVKAIISKVTDCEYGYSLKADENNISYSSTNEFNITENGVYIFALKNAKLDLITKKEMEIKNIDTGKPAFESPAYTIDNNKITIHAKDEKSSSLLYKKDSGNYDQNNVFEFLENSTHTFQVKDQAGNESDILTVDKTVPKINEVKLKTKETPVNGYFTSANVYINANDNVSAKNLSYAISKETTVPSESDFKVGSNIDGDFYDIGELPMSDKDIYVYVRDAAGNVTQHTFKKELNKHDNTAPELNIDIISKTLEESNFADKNLGFEMKIDASDSQSGLHSQAYAVIKLKEGDKLEDVASNASFDNKSSFTFKTGGDFSESGTYLIIVRDALGNTKFESKDILFDETKPTVETAHIDFVSTIVNNFNTILGFSPSSGITVTVSVPIKDSQIGVDQTNTKLIAKDLDGNVLKEYNQFVKDGDKYSFEVSIQDQLFNLYVTTQDLAGNKEENKQILYISKDGGDISLPILLDNNKPTISNETVSVSTKQIGDKEWIKEDATITYLVSDIVDRTTCSGIQSIKVSVNGIQREVPVDAANKVNEQTIAIKTNEYIPDDNGKLHILIEVKDNADNSSDTFTRDMYVDKQKPKIQVAQLNEVPYLDNAAVKTLGYVALNSKQLEVTVPIEEQLSGIDIPNTQLIVKKGKEIIGRYNAIGVKDRKYTFNINKKDVLFEMYISTCDNLGNSIVEERLSYDIGVEKYSLPILLDVNKPSVSNEKINTEVTRLNGKDWLNKNTTISYLISDLLANTENSGLRSVQLSVNGVEQDIKIDNTKKVDTQTVLIHTSQYITKEDGSLKIIIKVIDNAGNEYKFTRSIYIDLDRPQLSISYNNNAHDAQYTNIYKAGRVATLSIKELNFDYSQVNILVTEEGATKNIKPKWELVSGVEGTKNATYQSKVIFDNNSDYRLSVSGKDRVGHNLSNTINDAFTIDKTKPILSISYDNNKNANRNYYNAYRTATVVIEEHNFDSRRLKILGEATDNGNKLSFPTISNWTTNGDIHTAKIGFHKDAYYKLAFEYVDNAGNSIPEFTMQDFYIDTTAPRIDFSGIVKNSTNRGNVTPSVEISDINYDNNSVTINYSGAHRGSLKFDGLRSSSTQGETFTWANLAQKKINDDVYSIHATVKDKAGNSTESDISYSVNRFGSTYQMSNDLSRILNDKYITNCGDIVFSEINVNTVETVVVKLSVNGQVRELQEGVDFTVVRSNENSWNRYIYTIKSASFDSDGIYQIIVTSTDSAGNINENIIDNKEANIVFTVDKTAPTIAVGGIESKGIYNTSKQNVQIMAEDNIELSKLEVFLNDKIIPLQEGQFNPTIEIPESNNVQTLQVIASDKAGNKYESKLTDFTISTNLFVRLYMNKTALFGIVIGAVAVIGGVVSVMIRKRNKHS